MSNHIQHRAPCPTCHRPAIHEVIATRGTVHTAHYLCEQGHAWQTTWSTAA
jgi:hypothetical protein